METVRIMEYITQITCLHIGKQRRKGQTHYFVVLNSNPNERKPVWQGVACWIAQIPLFMGTLLGALTFPSTIVEGYALPWIILSAAITVGSYFGLSKMAGIFQKRPSWDKEDYVPTDEELRDWDHWVHCEEEYNLWGN